MSLLGSLIQNSARIGAFAETNRLTPADQQYYELYALLRKARNTAFGRFYGFTDIRESYNMIEAFQRQVPAADYNALYDRWWSQAYLCDSPDVCWPGRVPYYALSSGTSQAASKIIPVTEDMFKSMKRGSRRLFYDMNNFSLRPNQFTKHMLMVGSCTAPKREGLHWSGDLSGILGLNRPIWLERYYRPGREITDLPEWNMRIDRIAEEAPGWDIGFAVSNPMWLQLILERIIDRYKLEHIHQLWPNFNVFVHGSVFFDPYRPSFEKLLGHSINYVDSYLASEGFFAYQRHPSNRAMKMLTDCGIFFEFVPFNDQNFDENGDLRSPYPEAHTLYDVREGENYAMLISTTAGAWRYLLGDTVQFTDAANAEMKLTGRTKQYLSVCGEHLSIDNLNAAVQRADELLNVGIREFTVAGVRDENGTDWKHHWFVSVENNSVSAEAIAKVLDEALAQLNDDYAVERIYALKKVELQIVPNDIFLNWLENRGKMNGQAKVPRVLKGKNFEEFVAFAKEAGY
jgi:hypothetical protein